ncbi:MAG: DUF533 domain-containing protein [Myxococcota bacterium]
MTDESQRAMATWIGTLSSGGFLRDADDEAGIGAAAAFVGEARLAELRRWMVEQPEAEIQREQRMAITVLIAMAHADRVVDPAEVALLEEVIAKSRLDAATQAKLAGSIHDWPALPENLADLLTHPVLRELLLALAWETAVSDGTVDRAEEVFAKVLAMRMSIDADRCNAIRDAIVKRTR